MSVWGNFGASKIDREAVAAQIHANKAKIKDLEAETDELWAQLQAELGEGQHSVGDFIVKFDPQWYFDPKLAEKKLSPEDLERISVSKPDSTLAKKLLGEEVFSTLRSKRTTFRKDVNHVV